jgi:hypothetical protein
MTRQVELCVQMTLESDDEIKDEDVVLGTERVLEECKYLNRGSDPMSGITVEGVRVEVVA